MTKLEWVQRARMHYANRTQDFAYDWESHAEIAHDELLDGFEDDPEGAVDEEISNWD